jgi:hypothetical protein
LLQHTLSRPIVSSLELEPGVAVYLSGHSAFHKSSYTTFVSNRDNDLCSVALKANYPRHHRLSYYVGTRRGLCLKAEIRITALCRNVGT